MGEAVAVSGGVEKEASAGTMKWDRFVAGMAMRVLLVEADDSTRQVIAALLRKCGYTVAAVSDGLKAWELLKGTPHNVDLILTEVELPSISGFALLALAVEHDICKNIPVIMMSSQDSMGTVYKCMQKGAVDYLFKPIRRNELQNLWQHVWRRRSLPVDRNWIQDEGGEIQSGKAAAEKDVANNQANDSMTCTQRDEEFIDRASDVQSSCMGSDCEPEIALKEHQLNWSFMQKKPTGLTLSSCGFGLTLSLSKEAKQRTEEVATEGSGDNELPAESYRVAVDLIGALDGSSQHHHVDYSLQHSVTNHDLLTKLNLSLRRSSSQDFDNLRTEEGPPVKQSNASAFSRYANNACHLPVKKYGSTKKEKPRVIDDYSYEAPTPLSTPKSILSWPTSWSKQDETLPIHKRLCPTSVPVKVLRSNCPSNDLPLPSPSPDSQQEPYLSFKPSSHFFQKLNNLQLSTNPNTQNVYIGQLPEIKFDAFEDRRHWSLPSDRSANSSYANESFSQLNGMDRGYTAETCTTKVIQQKDEGSGSTLDKISQQCLQREAALEKFRLKRKVRCFEKKVRYESRKKLAEQRPRVKGQFVRQMTVDMCTESK